MRRNWKLVAAGLALLLVGGGAWAWFSFLWVFFVKPADGGPRLNLPMTVLAGNGEPGFVDGQGPAARMNKPIRLAPLGPGRVVFADINNHAVRTVDLQGNVRTLAGAPDRAGHQDGAAAEARFQSPHGVAVRADGAIAVAEATGNTVRLLLPAGDGWVVSTLAGVPGVKGFQDGPAPSALFNAPHAVQWLPSGGLLVADIGNHRVRKVQDGVVSTVAGTGEAGALDGPAGTLDWPMDLSLSPSGELWIVDAGNLHLRRWREGAGLDTPRRHPQLAMPHGVTSSGPCVWVAEMYGHRVLQFTEGADGWSTACGEDVEGADARHLRKPAAVLAHDGHLWMADLGNHRVLAAPLPAECLPR